MKNTAISPIEFASPGLLRIFASMVYDSLLLVAISIGYSALVVGLRVLLMGTPEHGHRIEWGVFAGTFVTIGWFVVLMFFYIYFWQKFGQTLGMKTWRIQLVNAQTNALPSYSQCVKRAGFALLSMLLLGCGYWYKLINPQGRLLHDLLSDTKLILLNKS